MILKTLCRSTKISTETKKELIEKVLKDDKSDIARRTRLTCETAFATLENKEKYWNILVDENTEYSIYDREAIISGFCSWDQLELCEPFAEKFYDALTTLSDKHAQRYQHSFAMGLMPRKQIKDEHLVRLMIIKSQVPDTNKPYMNLLSDVFELLLRSKRIRDLSLDNSNSKM
jgi:hypothetical protein